ncbi:MAG: SPOR domain-containing protein [candidate division KSB1 bacterium]|nr:SPOR domain-containing protein [candidate division KSB1 bacterium]
MRTKLVWLLGMALLAGCAGSRSDKGEAPATESRVGGMEHLDESFDPATLNDPEYPIKPKSQKASSPLLSQTRRTEQADTTEQQLLGYRVQILQTEDAEEARKVQKEAILDLDAEVYLIYDNPYYKLRVGDFRTRYEAEQFLEKVIRRGYSAAWIVRTKINPPEQKQ